MNRFTVVALCVPLVGVACTTLTPAQQTAVNAGITAAIDLASYAAQHNTTAAAILGVGALACGAAVSPTGVLIGGGIQIIETAAGVPASVVNAGPAIVAATCAAIGKVPGAVPPGTDPATLALTVINTVLPAVAGVL
jgi:hypothetical protein